ncbi:MAG: hypothetical protein WBR18_08090 [Anaerolineales bacterium]
MHKRLPSTFVILLSATALVAIGGCGQTRVSPTPGDFPSEPVAARQTLFDFFESLNAGDFARAVDLYSGSYEIMIDHNPAIDPDDHAALLRAACTINGAVCLKVDSAQLADSTEPMDGQFMFQVRFRNDDGSAFRQKPCCGADAGEGQEVFQFRVVQVAEHLFQVADSPIYMP